MAYNAIQQEACMVDMERDIFQAQDLVSMIQAIRMVVHKNVKPQQAYEFYQGKLSKKQ